MSFFLLGNMASPVTEGTLGTRPFINKHVAVVHENLFIKLDKNFNYADFQIEYIIEANEDGLNIPLLFYASEYKNGFKVEIDGNPIAVKKIPDSWGISKADKFNDFDYVFNSEKNHLNEFEWEDLEENMSFGISSKDFLYFETDISKGKHIIKVNYTAVRWMYKDDWLKSYSFRYALAPAKYWKSFGTLDITIDSSNFNEIITTNLGSPTKTEAHVLTWTFNKLPTDVLRINFKPTVSSFTQTLINLEPFGLALIIGIILTLIHLFLVYYFRKQNPLKKYSSIVILGSLVVPILFILSWIFLFGIIDDNIGEHASKRHGYAQVGIVVLTFFIIPVYFLVMWIIDRLLKRKMINRN